ncbi:MAG: DUF1697 domain-containing protein [Anaeromyxobacter sp.]
MPRYAAFLRGVMPQNCKMPALKAAFEAAGFTDVKTVLGSGNVVFTARAARPEALARKAEAAMQAALGNAFATQIREVEALRALLEADPFAAFELPAGSKRVVTFLRQPAKGLKVPIALESARILGVEGCEAFSAYVPDPKIGPVFMQLIEKTFGKDVTTRTWDTVAKVAK